MGIICLIDFYQKGIPLIVLDTDALFGRGNFIIYLRIMPLTSLNRIERRRLTVFLSCLIVAFATWMLIALSGNYKYRVDSRINYIDPPENRAYHPLQEDSVSLQIEGSGWQLLFSRLRLQPPVINVSLSALSSRSYIVFSNQMNDLNKQFESNQRVIAVNPDTLFFDFSKRSVKKVPIKLIKDISFVPTYGISGPIKLIPDHVIVNGAAVDLKKFKFWPTSVFKRVDVKDTILAKVGFIKSNVDNMDIFPLSVKVEIPIERFTEKIVKVPIKVLNAEGYDVHVLPEKVSITVLTALSRYASVNQDSFEVSINLKDSREQGYSQLPLKLTHIPGYSKLVKVDPQVVDFFIKK